MPIHLEATLQKTPLSPINDQKPSKTVIHCKIAYAIMGAIVGTGISITAYSQINNNNPILPLEDPTPRSSFIVPLGLGTLFTYFATAISLQVGTILGTKLEASQNKNQ